MDMPLLNSGSLAARITHNYWFRRSSNSLFTSRRVRFSFGLFHHLTYKETDCFFFSGLKIFNRLRIRGYNSINDFGNCTFITDLYQPLLLNDLLGPFPLSSISLNTVLAILLLIVPFSIRPIISPSP